MKRSLLIALLAFGTVAGYTSGFHHLRARHCRQHQQPNVLPSAAPAPSATPNHHPTPLDDGAPPATSGPE
jgi:hypothetical protein